MNKKQNMLRILIGAAAAVILVLLDQWTKVLAVASLKGQNDFVIIDGVLRLHYLENTGAAFSMMEGRQGFFLILTPIVCILICLVYIKMPSGKRFTPLQWTLIFVLSGAVGNYIDRFAQRYVVDFIYFELIDFPVFNVADIYVTLSMIALILLIIFYYTDEELSQLNPFRRKTA